jgi:hypothetical protein
VKRQRLLKRLEEVNLWQEEAQGLVERMNNGTFSEADRQRTLEVLRAEQEALPLLEAWRSPTPNATQRAAKRKRQMVKAARHRNRRL